MLHVGLTGGIASGKTVVRRHLASRGIPTLDADEVVHGLFAAGTDVTREISERFGPQVLDPEGAVDRRALGRVVFGDAQERKALEAIVHPRVFEAIEQFFREARERGDALAVVDAALMFETGSYRRYDRVVVAYCPRDLQVERLVARDGLSLEAAERRIAAQMPAEEKRDRADYVIDTSGTMEETLERTEAVLEQLLPDAQRSES